MNAPEPEQVALADWWATSLIHIAPGVIEIRGRPIEELIRKHSLIDVIWLMLGVSCRRRRPAGSV